MARMVRHTIELTPEIEKRIADWRGRQRPIPTFKKAVQQLLKKALRENKL